MNSDSIDDIILEMAKTEVVAVEMVAGKERER